MLRRRNGLQRIIGINPDIDIYGPSPTQKRQRRVGRAAEGSVQDDASSIPAAVVALDPTLDDTPIWQESDNLLDSNDITDTIMGDAARIYSQISADVDSPEHPLDTLHDTLQDALDAIPAIPVNPIQQAPEADFSQDEPFEAESVSNLAESSMFPPSRRPSWACGADVSEEVPHPRSSYVPEDFQLVLGLWCEVTGISRENYTGLLEAVGCAKSLSDIRNLPKTLTTLKSRVKASLPMMKMRRQEVPLIVDKIPTHSSPVATMYWFDPVPFFTTMLSSNSFVSQLHLGMADFVDEPKELWHSRSWASSIRASSGKYALFPDGQPAFPSDIVIFGCSRDLCQRCRDRNWHIGRILAVGRDFTSNGFTGRATSGQIALKVQTLLQQSELPESIISKLGPATPQSATELFLVEDEQFFVGEKDLISREEDVFLNYMFDLSGGGSDITVSQKLFIQRSVDLQSGRIRSLNMTTPTRGQLELETFGRIHFVQQMGKKCMSIPFLCFIDGFGLYRNMYRSLMGVYIILAGMNIAERFRRANVFPITLGPHGSNFEDVVKALRQLAVLDGGVDIDLNGEKVHITAFVLAFTGDMPQQQANSGFMGPRANRSCRYCLVDKAERRNLDFDVAQQGRYHHQTVRLRREAMSKNKTQKASFHQHLGMTPLPSPLVNIAPALDIIRSRPSDPAHSEYLGIAEPAHALLIHDILTNRGQVAYNEVLRHFPFPPGWARLQSPLRHFGSYSIQEHARASIVVPILLRCWLKESLIRASFTMGIRQVFREEAQLYSPVDLIVRCFGAMAKSHSILMSQSLSQADKGRMMDIIKEGRRSYQKLFEAAALAVGSSGRRSCGSTPASPSRTPSPSSVRSPEPNILTTTTDEEPSQADPGETSSVPTKKAHEYRNSQGRPNIHIALHYPDIIEEYGTAFNCNVLMGEDKHKFFKKIIYQSNHRSPERMLLGRECLQQTVRFLLAGSYAATEADLTSKMDRLHRSCPSVFKAILPPSEYLEESDESKLGLMSDNIHQDPTAIGCIPTNFARDTLDLPIRLNHRRVDDPFVASLIKAYDIDYGIRHVVELGRLPLQWCKKFSFTKATTNKRLSFQVGDYITFRQDCVGRIDYIFVHEIVRGDRRMFLWVTMVETCQPQQQEKDNVLGLPLLKLKDAKSVVGLPAVSGERIYMVPLKERDGVVSDDGEEKLLHCTWQIDFL